MAILIVLTLFLASSKNTCGRNVIKSSGELKRDCLDLAVIIFVWILISLDVGWKLFNDFDRCDVIEICFTWPVSVYFWEESIAASLAQSVDCVAVGGPRRNRL